MILGMPVRYRFRNGNVQPRRPGEFYPHCRSQPGHSRIRVPASLRRLAQAFDSPSARHRPKQFSVAPRPALIALVPRSSSDPPSSNNTTLLSLERSPSPPPHPQAANFAEIWHESRIKLDGRSAPI
ncbi:hypothetical protein KM043_006367 [Ampulex compressa]|nr:hypothetical protein KM043_006367 [Ampulex compressa]